MWAGAERGAREEDGNGREREVESGKWKEGRGMREEDVHVRPESL